MYPNGRAPESALVHVFGCVASPDMARRVAATKRDYEAEVGDPLIVNEIYRTYDEQVRQKARWTALGQPGNAATPGYSNHGNWDVGAVDWSSNNIAARRKIALRYGLHHDIANETWHATNWDDATRPIPELADFGLAGLAPTPIPEDDMYTEQDRTRDISAARRSQSGAIQIFRGPGGDIYAAAPGFWAPIPSMWHLEIGDLRGIFDRSIMQQVDSAELGFWKEFFLSQEKNDNEALKKLSSLPTDVAEKLAATLKK